MQPRKLKRSVLKEEFVAITGCPIQAIILNQFLYWTERVKDFDEFIEEEKQRNPATTIELTHGWIYKKSADLVEETMLCRSEDTIRRALKALIDKGILSERDNPYDRWNKTKQYRVDLWHLQSELSSWGYSLEGYTFPVAPSPEGSNTDSAIAKTLYLQNPQNAVPKTHTADSRAQNADTYPQNAAPKPQNADTYIRNTEITTETTNREEESQFSFLKKNEEDPSPAGESKCTSGVDFLQRLFEVEKAPWFINGDRNTLDESFAFYVLKTITGVGAYENKQPSLANAKNYILAYLSKPRGSDERFFLFSRTNNLWDGFKSPAISVTPENINAAISEEMTRLKITVGVLPVELGQKFNACLISELNYSQKLEYLAFLQAQKTREPAYVA
jgi:hypothetical protein